MRTLPSLVLLHLLVASPLAGRTATNADAATAADTLAVVAPASEPSGLTRPLEGFVQDAQGTPLPDALVRIVAITPSTPDRPAPEDPTLVGQTARTDAEGRFQFAGVPHLFLYDLVLLADGCVPFLYRNADPAFGPIRQRLKPSIDGTHDQPFSVRARLVELGGEPVAGALIEPDGVETLNSTSWGGSQGFPEWVISGRDGEFVMARAEPFSQMSVDVRAPGLAPAKVWLPASNAVQTVTLGPGACLTGRVLKNGQPLGGLRVEVTGVERDSRTYAGHYEAVTRADGQFEFEHLPPRTAWWLSGTIDSFKSHGALPPRQVRSGDHLTSNALGDLSVVPGLRLAGEVRQVSGEPPPPGFRLYVSYDNVSASPSAQLSPDGKFNFEGLHHGLTQIGSWREGWRLAPANRSLDEYRSDSLHGLLNEDKTNLLVLIEPSPTPRQADYGQAGRLPPEDQPQNRPLRGAEPDGRPDVILAGTVVDAANGEPLPSFLVTPGRRLAGTGPSPTPTLLQRLVARLRRPPPPPANDRWWNKCRASTFTNGGFRLSFEVLRSAPMFRIEADGYAPFDSEPMPLGRANLVIRLTRSPGPGGTVVGPDDKPVADAQVILGAPRESLGQETNGVLRLYSADPRFTARTDAQGRFGFRRRPEATQLLVSHPLGWAALDAKDLAPDMKVRLQAWAVVVGRLVDTNGVPVTSAPLAPSGYQAWSRGQPQLNLPWRSTDAQGRFRLEFVPPIPLDLVRYVPMGNNSFQSWAQIRFVARPGRTNDLGTLTIDQPPPESPWESLRRKLGL